MTTKETQIEQSLIQKLIDLKYSYRPDIRDREALEQNFREKFEALNRVHLTDAEFARLRDEIVTADAFSAAKTLRERNYFQREDGTTLHYTLVNCKNDFEVINQLRINTENSHHRYDVILLINGVPVVQIELKNLQVSPRRAMEQIVEYKNDPGNGYTNTLLCFMQLFIVSNESNTYYFANNHNQHFSFNADERFLPIYQLADEANQKIAHLHDFADSFLAKCTLGQMISRYMVLVASEQKLMIMRPYQIYAVKAIVDCIHQNRGNGYIWHTTGSGKTLTSFKASMLLKDNPDIEKCLFVVDRKDFDRQTREEFNRFQDGCVEENTNTETLVRRMLSEDFADKVIVTTIQKLGLALDENSKRNQSKQKNGKLTYKQRLEPLSNKRIVFIFDECHRSQFGENHKAIKEFFPKAQLFGFTGTPIFNDNASYTQIDGTVGSFKTTKDIFEKELHAYTITHAIDDKNVLGFHIDYFGKDDENKKKLKKGEIPPPEAVIKAILKKHDAATNSRRFNALLATASINSAIEYFEKFKVIQAQKSLEDDNFQPLNIACAFSPPVQLLDTDNKNSKNAADTSTVQQLEFEFVLFASAVIDYDYIMGLIAKSTQDTTKQKMTRQDLIDLISSSANLMDERDDIIAYINSLKVGEALNETAIREGYQAFKAAKVANDLVTIAEKHHLDAAALQAFVDTILSRMIFDGEKFSELLAPLELGWKTRTQAELALMADLVPLLNKLAQVREISGLSAYE